MQEVSPQDIEFLNQLTAKVEENIAQENFGVSELADLMNMSRSNLLRRVKRATSLSVAQLINQTRLKKAMELLRTGASNVSEVGHQVGFSSTSYFIKCFREHYGYPPGETNKRENQSESAEPHPYPKHYNNSRLRMGAIAIVLVVVVASLAGWWIYLQSGKTNFKGHEKSIVVLPFKNDSSDSTNVYLINGVMEETLNNLQKIKDLRVLSRTSAEKFRNTTRTIPEMATELNANYFIEGSGQKIGDRIVLNVQLIDGRGDRHLWSKQYRREVKDIFTLQQEISKDIADEIAVIITPDERNRIEKIPTRNPEAYDAFLKGMSFLNKRDEESLKKALSLFQVAIKNDSSFALAYATAGFACFYLDFGKKDREHLDLLGNYADKALLYDPKLEQSLMAKATYYILKKEFVQVPFYLEKALEYNPNSSDVLALLADHYGMYLPNTGKYLEYTLKGLKVNANSGDSVQMSYFYLRLGNALIQSGFIDESLHYIDKSIAYYPLNPFSKYVRAFIVCANDTSFKRTRQLLLDERRKDPNRLDILKDIGKVSYYLHDYKGAASYFDTLMAKQEAMNMDLFQHENMILSVTYDKVGEKKKAKAFKESYIRFLTNDQSSYNDLGWAVYYSYIDDKKQSLDHLKLFAREDNIQFWVVRFVDDEPMLANVKDLPEFKQVFADIKDRFWKNHAKIRARLEEQGVSEFLSKEHQ